MHAGEAVPEESGNCRGIKRALLRDQWLGMSYHTYMGLLNVKRLVRRIGSMLGGHFVAGGRYQKCLSDLQPR